MKEKFQSHTQFIYFSLKVWGKLERKFHMNLLRKKTSCAHTMATFKVREYACSVLKLFFGIPSSIARTETDRQDSQSLSRNTLHEVSQRRDQI